jgi:hypothetical protein
MPRLPWKKYKLLPPSSKKWALRKNNSANKTVNGSGGMNGVYRLTESSAVAAAAAAVSPTTTISSIPTLAVDELEGDTIEVPPPMDIQAQPKLLPDTNVDKANTTDESLSHAPISIVAGLSASDFHIPAALSVTTPPINVASSSVQQQQQQQQSISSVPSSPSIASSATLSSSLSSSNATVIPNDTPSEQIDEVSIHDIDAIVDQPLTTTNDEPVDDRTRYGEKRRHNIIELIDTEKEYVKDLVLIVEGYMNVIENDKDIKKPPGLVGIERIVFGNVQRIYEFHRDTFLPQLEQCIENPDILGRLFTMNRFSPYVRYCENKPRSEYVVSAHHDYFEEIRKKLGQKLLVSDLLIKPVQRIMRYQLLLKEILKSTERMGDDPRAIRSALQVMIEVPTQANDMMNVGRVKDLPGNVHALGALKLQDILAVSEPISKETKDAKEAEKKLKDRRVFLFQQAIAFCDEIPAKDKYSSPNYIYKYELKINKLQHKDFKRIEESFQFILVEIDAGNTRRVICQCKDDEQFQLWVTNLHKVLQSQKELLIALTNPTAALQKEQDSSFTSTAITISSSSSSAAASSSASIRSHIKKSMSDRTGKSPEPLPPPSSPSHHYLSTSPKKINSPSTPLYASSSRTLSSSDTNEQPKKASSSFNLFDSILPRSTTKPLTINTTNVFNETKRIIPSSSSSLTTTTTSSLMPNVQLPEQARCLHSYNALKEDEICVNKGEYVQIVAANQDNRWFVHRDANRTSPAAEGWLPGFVIGLKHPNSISPPSSSLSVNSLHHLTTSSHHPTITYESTLPPKPQTNTYDKV